MENLFNSFQNNHWFVNVLIIGGILYLIIDTFFPDIFTKDDSKYKVQKRDDGKYILTDKATGEVHIINAKDSLKYGFKIEGIVYDTQQKKSPNESVNFKTKSSKYKVQKRKDGKYILTNKATAEVHVINAKDSLKYGIRIKGIEYNYIEKNDLSDKVNKQNNSQGNENVSEEDYNVYDTVTGKVIKVDKETAKKVAKDQKEWLQSKKHPGHESVLGFDLYKNDLSGLEAYFKQRPNIRRIHGELLIAVDKGQSVKEYLKEAGLFNPKKPNVKIMFGALVDITGFYKKFIKSNKSVPIIRKDYKTSVEAMKILESLLVEQAEWTDEELAVLFCLLVEIEWAAGEMNKSTDFKNLLARSITSAIKLNMSDEERSEYAEKIMQIQTLGENLYANDDTETGDLLKIRFDYNFLTSPKKDHISKCVSMLMDNNKHPKKVEMAKFFGISIMNVNYDSDGYIFFT